MSRSRILSRALGVAWLTLILLALVTTVAQAAPLGPKTPIKHVIVLMQEGHSFDNYFGTYPGADGIPADTCIPINPSDPKENSCIKPFRLGERPVENLNPGETMFKAQYNNGQMNGFVYALRQRDKNGALSMGYYDEQDLPYYWNIADEYVLFDRYFSSTTSDGVNSRMFWISGVAAAPNNRIPKQGFGDLPTIFDRLEQRGISWKFYVQNYDPKQNYRAITKDGVPPQLTRVPLLAFDRFIDNPQLSSKIADLDQYYEDLRNNTLPEVVYIASSSGSERAPSNIQSGPLLVRSMVNALMQSSAWSSSAFLITYDGWGGWYDHVAPPMVDDHGYGFRVPAMLISPYARRGYIDHTLLDHTSILKFIQQNYDLPALSTRDAQATSLISGFDFAQAPREAKIISIERTIKPYVEPRRDVIYLCYSAIFFIAGSIVAWAIFSSNTRSQTSNLIQTQPSQDGLS